MSDIARSFRSLRFAAMLTASAALSTSALADPAKNVILVHGAWADDSSGSKVIPMLNARGLHVVAVQLPLTSLADDAATVKRAIALESGPVVLVGHSYGGAVITEAGNDPKVSALVYVAAFAPDNGQSAGALNASGTPAPLGAESKPDAEGFISLTKTGVYEDFAQDLPEADKAVLFAQQAPTSVKALGGNITSAAWHTQPPWSISAATPTAIP